MKRILVMLLLIVLIITSCAPTNVDQSVKNNSNKNAKESSQVNNDNSEVSDGIDQNNDNEQTNNNLKLEIVRCPSPQDLSTVFKERELPKYRQSGWPIDLRSGDLSSFDIKDRLYDLMNADFDSLTKWPEELPEGFNPDDIMEIGKNPGLNVRSLHNEGITGKDVGIAIIDFGPLVDHVEYKDRLKMYEEIHNENPDAHFHGSGVASLAGGKTTGVAPEADIYFIGCEAFDYNREEKKLTINFSYTAEAIERILQINKDLPEQSKIRVISISSSWNPELDGYEEVKKAV